MQTLEKVHAGRGGEVIARMIHLRDPVGVEVGVWEGDLAACVLHALPRLTWHMVDRWSPPPADTPYASSNDSKAIASIAAHKAAYARACGRVGVVGARAVIHHGESVEIAQSFPNASIDLLFLDGDHTPEGVAADLDAWSCKVRPGGWIGGHDWRPANRLDCWHVGPAVWTWREKRRIDNTLELGRDKTWFFRLPSHVEVAN